MKHDEAHEKKQNKGLETVIEVLIAHIERDQPHATDTLDKLRAVRDELVADDKDGAPTAEQLASLQAITIGTSVPRETTADKVDWSKP